MEFLPLLAAGVVGWHTGEISPRVLAIIAGLMIVPTFFSLLDYREPLSLGTIMSEWLRWAFFAVAAYLAGAVFRVKYAREPVDEE